MPVSIQDVIEEPWTLIEPIRVGRVPPGLGTPDIFVLAEIPDAPYIRIDVYGDSSEESLCFQEAELWRGWVVIGFGHTLYLVAVEQGNRLTIPLGSYFGHLYPADDLLLAASATHLFCFKPDGTKKWTSPALGIDGVIVGNITQDVIYGDGEMDPPGGWEPFQVRTGTGELMST